MEVAAPPIVRFGLFAFDCETGELTKRGHKVALRPQAARILGLLVCKPGQLVTRDDLHAGIWGTETYVDFDHGLNLCIQEIRAALHDDATCPIYIETLPRRGYRFIAPVRHDEAETPAAEVPPVVAEVEAAPRHRFHRGYAAAVVAVVVVLGTMLYFGSGKDASAVPRTASIAVLPLTTNPAAAGQKDLAAGVMLELVRQLGRVESLRVISSESSMEYKNSSKPAVQIARELNVSNILSGSLERAGDRVRMVMALTDGRSGNKLWSQRYDSDLSAVLDTENDIAHAVASNLNLPLTSQDSVRLRSSRGVLPKAHTLFLKALAAPSYEEMRRLLEEAVAVDPNFSMAWGALATWYVDAGWFSQSDPPTVTYRKAKEAALHALAIDDSNSDAHAALAAVKLHNEWDWPGAEREFRRAIETSPSNGYAHHIYAHYLLTMDRLRESVAESRMANDLNPLNPDLATCVGWHCLYARQYDDAVAQCLSLVNDQKAGAFTYYYLGRVYARRADFDRSIPALEVAAAKSGAMTAVLATLAHVYARAGRRADAEKVLGILTQRSHTQYVAAFDMAVAYTGFGDSDKTFDWLEKAYLERSTWLVHLKWDERFATLRGDPRFVSLLRRIGLPHPDNVVAPEQPAPVRLRVAAK